MKFEDKTISINGRKVFYRQLGQEKQGTVVFLHGYPGNYEGLSDLAKEFGDTYRIIMPNFPSCGGSEPLEGSRNLNSFADWLSTFLMELKVNQVTIVGHSFGSRVALTFADSYPKKVKHLVLITPVLKADSMLVYVVLLKYKLAKLLSPRLQKKFLSSKLYEYVACKIVLKSKNSARHKKIIERGFKELEHVHPETQIDLFEEFYRSDLTLLTEKITIPTLVIAGQEDEVAVLKSIKEFAVHMKQVSLSVLKGGHLVPFERPRAVANIIISWLESQII